jgi:PAS domain S-box-containing protein
MESTRMRQNDGTRVPADRKQRADDRVRLLDAQRSTAEPPPIAVLMVLPHAADASSIRRMLVAAESPFEVEHAQTIAAALARLSERRFDSVLIDLTLAAGGGEPTVARIHGVAPQAAVIALAADQVEGAGARVVVQGAQDSLSKSELVAPLLVRTIRHAVERQRLVAELERRVHEAEASARDFRTIFRTTADAIVIVDGEGIVRLVNPCAETLFGRAADDLVGQMFGFPIVAGDTTEIDIVRPDGAAMVAELRASRSEWNDQPAYLAAIRDITERRQVEEHERQLIREQVARAAAEAGERRARFLGEASRVLLSSFDLPRTLQELAELATPVLGEACLIDIVEPDGTIARLGVACSLNGGEALAPRLRGNVPPGGLEEVSRVLRTRRIEVIEALDRDALERLAGAGADALEPFGFTTALVVPLTNRIAVGCVTFLAGPGRGTYSPLELTTAEDLGRRALVAIENTRLYQEAQKANQAKADFLAVMSHELRTPLNAIIGYSDLLLMGVPAPVPDEAQRQIEKIRTSGRHLLGLIEEILSFARMEAGREQVRAHDVSLIELGREVADITAPLAESKAIRFDVQLPADDTILHTDAGKVRQIVLNLLSNAVKFTDEGAVRLLVERQAASVEFHVRDSGIGIQKDDVQHIFDPFWQAESSRTRRAEGTGLGLAVARRFARMLGGDITVWSEPGSGTTFTVRLPIRAPRGGVPADGHENAAGESPADAAQREPPANV